MAKPYGEEVGACKKCGEPIGNQNPEPRCLNCGEPLTHEVLSKIPRLASGSSIQEAAEPSRPEITIFDPAEGSTAYYVGNTIIWPNIIGSIICIFAFARHTVPDPMYPELSSLSTTSWNPMLAIIFMAWGLNGAFFGYLLAKVGSILRRIDASAKST